MEKRKFLSYDLIEEENDFPYVFKKEIMQVLDAFCDYGWPIQDIKIEILKTMILSSKNDKVHYFNNINIR